MTLLPYLAILYFSDIQLERPVRLFADPVPGRKINLAVRWAYLKKHLIDACVATLREHLPPELAAT